MHSCLAQIQIISFLPCLCLDLGSQGESVKKLNVKTFLCQSICGQVATELVTV